MYPIIYNKFQEISDYTIHYGDAMFDISVYGKHNQTLYYVVYEIEIEYCGDCSFKPIPNEFNDVMNLTI